MHDQRRADVVKEVDVANNVAASDAAEVWEGVLSF